MIRLLVRTLPMSGACARLSCMTPGILDKGILRFAFAGPVTVKCMV